MPMYADQKVSINVDNVGNPNTDAAHEGHFILQETVNLTLTRSLAKIEVYAAEDAGEGSSTEVIASNAGIKITGVEIVNPVAEGKLFPLADTESTPDPGTDVLMELDLPENATENTVSVDKAVKDGNYTISGRYTPVTTAYYLAENDNGESSEFSYGEFTNKEDLDTKAAGATALKISYKVGKSDKTGYVIMPPIERNTWYKVLARIKANGQVTLTLIVKDWKDIVREEINFEDHVSLSQNITWSGDVNQGTQDGKTVLTFKGTTIGQTATCSFGMDAPKGGTWYVTLTGGNINGFELETTVGGKLIEGTSVSGPINPEQTVEVKVKTLTSTNLKEELRANLQIVAKSVDGRTLAVMDGSRNASFIIVQPSTNN